MKTLNTKTTALLLIDVINDFEFEGSEQLLRYALPAAKRLARLKERLAGEGVPVIYVNDNFGRWQSDFKEQIVRCSSVDSFGRDVANRLLPVEGEYFVLKPKHSGFYSTSLEVLLGFLGIETLILAGFASDICVLYTANDAYMRDYQLEGLPTRDSFGLCGCGVEGAKCARTASYEDAAESSRREFSVHFVKVRLKVSLKPIIEPDF